MSCHVSPRMLAGRPWMMSVAPMLTTCRPWFSAASRATFRFSLALYRLRGSSVGVLMLVSAAQRAGGIMGRRITPSSSCDLTMEHTGVLTGQEKGFNAGVCIGRAHIGNSSPKVGQPILEQLKRSCSTKLPGRCGGRPAQRHVVHRSPAN